NDGIALSAWIPWGRWPAGMVPPAVTCITGSGRVECIDPSSITFERIGGEWAAKEGTAVEIKADARAVGDETSLRKGNCAERIEVCADGVVGEPATIHIKPVIGADHPKCSVFDVAVLQAAAGRGVNMK